MRDRLDDEAIASLDAAMHTAVEGNAVPGLAWLVARGDDVRMGTAGTVDGKSAPVEPDAIFRISSVTKPIVATVVLQLVDDGTFGLDDPVDDLLPELADRRVLANPDGPLDDTVPARRPITVRDLLTFRLGLGMDFTRFGRQPVLDALVAAGLGAGPPAPAGRPPVDELLRILGGVPLEWQPGERWLYQLGADVYGALVERAAGRPLADVVHDRLLEPLGMTSTGFWVPPASLDRFGPHHVVDPESGERQLYDDVEGQWSAPPAFAGGGDGLVSTVADLGRFGALVHGGGTVDGERLLSPELIDAMTTDQLTDAQRRGSGPDPSGGTGWGFGIGVTVAGDGPLSAGSAGWDGGLGSRWFVDRTTGLTGVLLTNQAWPSPEPPALYDAFTACAAAAVR